MTNKYKIGDKVVPIAKTIGEYTIDQCKDWNGAKKINQPYLYVTEVREKHYTCGINSDSAFGNFYNESDLIPYVEDENTVCTDFTESIELKSEAQKLKEGTLTGTYSTEEAHKLIFGDREKDYGSATKNFTDIAKGWSVIFGTEVTAEQVCLGMTWLKLCRLIKSPAHRDSVVDGIGYLAIIQDKLKHGL